MGEMTSKLTREEQELRFIEKIKGTTERGEIITAALEMGMQLERTLNEKSA